MTGAPRGTDDPLQALLQDWRPGLLAYVGRGEETGLVRAQELGRGALEAGVNLVDLLEVHHRVAAPLVHEVAGSPQRDPDALEVVLDRCAGFLREAMTPYAMAQVAYRDRGATAAPPRG